MSFIVAFRASSEEIPLPVIPGLSSKPLDASNPHKQVCYCIVNLEYFKHSLATKIFFYLQSSSECPL